MNANYRWYTAASQQFLERDYLLPQQSLDERVNIIVNKAEVTLGIPGFAAKFKSYLQKGWYSLSTPIWTNFGTDRGLPISCFGSYIEDSMDSILTTHAEIGMMTKYGGGTSAFFGELRGKGSTIRQNGESSGPVHFISMFDTEMNVVAQGKTRRGNIAAYMNIDHPDIEEFLTIRGESSKIQDVSFGVCVPTKWLTEMREGDSTKRKIWAKVIEARTNIGYPYIFFTDNANNGAPQVYKDKGMRIHHSNLCTEIMLPNNAKESFVCDLSSMNILWFDEWKDTDAVQTLVYFLDAVMTEFIEKASKIKFLDRAVAFAEAHRALGVGWLGWHSYLQSKMIPFESLEAHFENTKIAKLILEQATLASRKLAVLFGEPSVLKGYGMRNTTVCAIAPTKSSAFILGQVSEGIEPHRANYYVKDLAKGKFTVKNPHLEDLLESKGQNTYEVWDSILKNAGSVQHLKCLTDKEKEVFKTFVEISPKTIIALAGARQKYIDQGQSLNLMIHPSTPIKDVNALILMAHDLGVKSLYYQISVNAAQEFSRNALTCVACES